MIEQRRKATIAWGSGVALALTAALAGLIVACLVRYTDVDKEPWAYIGLAVAALGAVAAILLGVIKARREATRPHPHP